MLVRHKKQSDNYFVEHDYHLLVLYSWIKSMQWLVRGLWTQIKVKAIREEEELGKEH